MLLKLALLTRIARKLRLQLRLLLLLLLLLLSKALRLTRIASELRLHWSSAETCRLRTK